VDNIYQASQVLENLGRRRLTKHADPFTEKRLLDLAIEYEGRIVELEKGYRLSPASRLLNSETKERR
jgi:hypothetical protein